MKRFLRRIVLAAIVVGAVAGGFYFWTLQRELEVTLPAGILEVNKASSASQLLQDLKDKQWIHSTKPFLAWLRAQDLTQRLKAGVYQIHEGETVLQLFKRIAAGDVIKQNFTIIAGTTVQKVSEDLVKASYLDYEPTDWRVLPTEHESVEGLLLAETYQYQGGSSGKTILTQAYRHLTQVLDEVWSKRADNLPYKTPYELLIAASIIEKETALPKERVLISGVMVNRLKKNMPLQMDPTVIYALGSAYTGKLSHANMQVDSPYNSYKYRGLPPTPIAMVGRESLEAAAHPQGSNYLYFVAKGDGSHEFSENYEQQKRAIRQYQRKRAS